MQRVRGRGGDGENGENEASGSKGEENEETLLPRNFTRPIFRSCFVRITVHRGGSSPPVHVPPPSRLPRHHVTK